MKSVTKVWSGKVARISVRRPGLIVLITVIITAFAMFLSSSLKMKMNWTDLLPGSNKVVQRYEEIQERFGNAGSFVIAIEGDYQRIVQMASALKPLLNKSELLYNVQDEIPVDFIREHGFVLLKENQFDRALRRSSDPGLTGSFRGLNNDFEREYSESESNMRRDEVEIARGILGLSRSLEILTDNFSGKNNAAPIEEAVDAFSIGERWMLSLDRRMLLIMCQPMCLETEIDSLMRTADELEGILDEVRPSFPDVSADLTGMGKIAQDEMNSIGIYTQILALVALVMIYLLLARSFRGWVTPLIALAPLFVGIIWTMGLLQLWFGSLNAFTIMMGLVLLGLGIDFSIHLISRFFEETGKGVTLEEALIITLGGTGVGVLTGGFTTAAAFLTLMIADTDGVYEFGAACGFGALLTLAAIFIMLPSLLVLYYRFSQRKSEYEISSATLPDQAGNSQTEGFVFLGNIARASWKHPVLFLGLSVLIAAFSIWGMKHIQFEYDWLNLEPKGLKSIQLQREIPDRFGMSDHASWIIAQSIEESRTLKKALKKKSLVGDVSAISDFIPSLERLEQYAPRLQDFKRSLNETYIKDNISGDQDELVVEIDRLWDNLDLMSNLAFASGLDRIVKVIDQITGTDSETGKVDKTAVLPTLSRMISDGVDETTASIINTAWFEMMKYNLIKMSNPDPIEIQDLPETVRRNHVARVGDGFLIHVVPRKYLWSKKDLDRFVEQTETVTSDVTGTEQLINVLFDEILTDGKKSALIALAVIGVLVLIHFHGLIGLLSLFPLAGGALSMLGLMYLFGMKYNYMNLISVPIILGIGIDDGIHALHRFREESGFGEDRISKTFSLVGRAIMLTSLTTMIGFGSIAFYAMEGMASFGKALFMGVGLCFISTIILLPASLRLFYGNIKKETVS